MSWAAVRLWALIAALLLPLAALAGPVRSAAPEAQAGVVLANEQLNRVPRSHGPSSMQIVQYPSNEAPGTIIISNAERTLHRILGGGKAERYEISVGRDGFTWTGTTFVGHKAQWPAWRPPAEMRKRQPGLPGYVPPGPYNPLGARALYLYSGGRDTLYRIHGTNNAATIGGYETSGCFRLTNTDVMDLFQKVRPGTKVIVR